MPLKIGGGNKLQFYDKDTGEYSDEQKLNMNEIDKENLILYHYYGIDDKKSCFHFPCYRIHDEEYCTVFCKFARDYVKLNEVSNEKIQYLLAFDKNKDRSIFLNSLGYNSNNLKQLCDDIYDNTILKLLEYSRITKWGVFIKAPTKLKGKIVTTIWLLDDNFTMKFVTLIPGGDKVWKKLK